MLRMCAEPQFLTNPGFAFGAVLTAPLGCHHQAHVRSVWPRLIASVLFLFVGPVRGVNFHKNQPLLVSGGDDYKIKVSPHLQ